MRQTNKPKGIKVEFFKDSEYRYYLCPNCYEYLMIDECPECGLICELEEVKNFNTETKRISKLKEIIEI